MTNVIDNLENSDVFEDIVRCLTFVLNTGQLVGNDNYKQNGKFSMYSIMGGGYGKTDSYPRSFAYRMPGGNDRQSVLDACNNTFCIALADTFIQSCYSTNWFDEYCQEDLAVAIDYAHAQAWNWGVFFGWSHESITEQLIPHVNENITNALVFLKEFTSNNPHQFLRTRNLSSPKIISEFWNLYQGSQSRDELGELVSKHNNISTKMLELLENGGSFDKVRDFVSGVREYMTAMYPKTFENQSEKIKKSISYEEFNTMWCIIERILPCCMTALSQQSGSIRAEEIEFSKEMWTGLDYVGNSEVIEKITNGMDSNTFFTISDDIRSYQMHAAERLATILNHKIAGEEPPEYIEYGKEPSADTAKDSEKVDDEITTGPSPENQTKLPLIADIDPETESTQLDLSGMWKGFHTMLDVETDESKKYEFELEIFHANGTFNGTKSSSGTYDLSITNGKVLFDNIIQFDMILDGNDLSKIQVDCEVKDWGVEGSFELAGNRENFIIHRNDSGSLIDSEKITSDALSQLVRELEKILPNYKSWDVNYKNLPLESAIDMAQYLMTSTVKKQRFNQELPSVGGPIRTMIITRDKGVKYLEDYIV